MGDEADRAYGPFLTDCAVADLRADIRHLSASVRALTQTVNGLSELIRTLFNVVESASVEPQRSTIMGVLPFNQRR